MKKYKETEERLQALLTEALYAASCPAVSSPPFMAPTGAWGIHESLSFTSVSLCMTVSRTP
jgi:hypothetical protein